MIPARITKRFLALLIDSFIVIILNMGIGVIFLFGMKILYSADPNTYENITLTFFMTPIIVIFYFSIMDCSKYSGSIGKVLCKIKVVDYNGVRISFVISFARTILKGLSCIGMIGFFIALFNEKRQALHDMITKCLVIENGE